MLSKETIELIVNDCMAKFARENDGSNGWSKEDILNAVLLNGGEQKDVYAAMALGMEKCFGEPVLPARTLLN
jgi:hypothetical protein